jgi:hypothetical protein
VLGRGGRRENGETEVGRRGDVIGSEGEKVEIITNME